MINVCVLINVVYVLIASPTSCSPTSLSLNLSIPGYNNIKIRPINNCTIASKCLSERKSRMSTTGEDEMKIVEMTTKDLEYYINLVDKTVTGLEKIDSNFESSTVGKMLLHHMACYKDIICETSIDVANCIVVLF